LSKRNKKSGTLFQYPKSTFTDGWYSFLMSTENIQKENLLFFLSWINILLNLIVT
jgi:hypothetical protein